MSCDAEVADRQRLEFAKMKKKENLNDWLARVMASQKNVETIHLDGLDENNGKQISGLELVRYAHAMLVSTLLFLRTLTYGHRVKHAMVFLPVGVSDEFLIWSPEIWKTLDCVEEPPSLYLLRDTQIFDDESEEYRRPISIPVETQTPLRAVFRSFRDQEAMANSWEFSSGVYLIASID